jgi:hypothetical protein
MYRAATTNYDLEGGAIVFFNWDTATVTTNGGVTYTPGASSPYDNVPYFQVSTSGLYSVGFNVVFSPALVSTDHLEIWASQNDAGDENQLNRTGVTTVGPNSTSAATKTLLWCNAGDTVFFYGYFYTGTILTVENTTTPSVAYVVRVSPT